MLSREQAMQLLTDERTPERVIIHCKVVARVAKRIAECILASGHRIDVQFVEVAALLHDVGRSKTHGPAHGLSGAEALRKRGLGEYARVAETHIGAGLTADEAEKLGLPRKDYLPGTLEEKVIAHADNLVEDDAEVPFQRTLDRFTQRFGADSPVTKRLIALKDEVESFM
ncbi:MAG: HDIG domain-containing protein [Candidatus Diapherotrites archaeon]|nr:HDIG domain-containing protein [Candidatus Diapherotrites archaeon]